MSKSNRLKLFTGNANPVLAAQVAHHLEVPLGNAKVNRFSDGEINVEIFENVRGHESYILQSTSAPCNDNLMELLIIADALRRASASNITAVVPYFGYSRQDRRIRSARVPITAKVVADMMSAVGIKRVVTIDLHAEQIQGFFYIPVDNVFATPIMIHDVLQKKYSAPMVVSPDVGGVVRARAVAKRLNDLDLAIIDKRRPAANKAVVMNIIGDVRDRNCIIVDDIIDTAGTLCHAAEALKQKGAATVTAYATHPIFSGHAIENIQHSALDEVIVTDTIPLRDEVKQCSKIRLLSIAAMLAETIHRVNTQESVSSMFLD